MIDGLINQHINIQYITLTRNFGYQSSVLCGLTYAKGDAIVINDVDCEDPPELIPKFVEKWEGVTISSMDGEEKGQNIEVLLCAEKFFTD